MSPIHREVAAETAVVVGGKTMENTSPWPFFFFFLGKMVEGGIDCTMLSFF